MINLHTHSIYPNGILNIYTSDPIPPSQAFSIGIHPWGGQLKNLNQELASIKAASKLPNCLAIGECGIDRLKGAPLSDQIKIFSEQVKLANTTQLPLIIHCVRAFEEAFRCIKQNEYKQHFIFHGYTKGYPFARKIIEQGGCISFGASILNGRQDECLKSLPKERIFFETDTGDPLQIDSLYNYASKIMTIDKDALILQVEANFKNIFNHSF